MSASVSAPRVGVWLIGARGSVATTVVAGCAAVTAGLHPPSGLVTETPAFADSGLPALSSLVFGGHDTIDCPLPKRAEALAAGGVLPHGLPAAIGAELAAADREIRPGGPVPGDTRSEEELVAAFAADIRDFVRRCGLARAVVVNVASTEPAANGPALPPSSLYAAAALRAGCPYVNFTPSTGLHHPAPARQAESSGLPYAGRDGKTGQTLLRSVLGPMFTQRALAVRAWSGTNLLGGGDGASLADPSAAAAKNAGKERVLADALGEVPEGQVHIDDVPALGDWKTAWDHIAFDGFLGTRMVLQTIWQGCDSALAAPLVLDLARLVSRAHEFGLSGPLSELGFYFKDPVGQGPSALGEQYAALGGFAERLREADAEEPAGGHEEQVQEPDRRKAEGERHTTHQTPTTHPTSTTHQAPAPQLTPAPAPPSAVAPLRFGYGTNGLADLRLDDALTLLADLGYDGVGLTLDHMHLDPLAPDLAARTRRLAHRLDALGLAVTIETGARYVLDPRRKHGPSLLDPDPDDRARRVDLLIRAVQVAADLGAHALHCFSGTTPADTDPDTAWKRLAEALAPVLDAATAAGIPLAVEPEPGHLLATLADFHRLRRILGDPSHLGLTLDIGHCQCLEPLPPAECVRAAGPWLRHVQIEDMRRGVHEHLPLGDGDIDFPPVLAALAATGYQGLTVVELPRHSHAGPHFAELSLPFLHHATATAATANAPLPDAPRPGEPSATPEGSTP